MFKSAAAIAVVILAITTNTLWAQQTRTAKPRVTNASRAVSVASKAPRRAPQAQRVASQQASHLFTQTSIEQGWQRASQQQRPMLVMFTSNNCRYCKKMLKETYNHPGIKRMLAANTETVLAHADDYPALVKRLGISGYPSSMLVSPQGEVVAFIKGYVPPQDFAKQVTPLLQVLAQQKQARITRSAGLPKTRKSLR